MGPASSLWTPMEIRSSSIGTYEQDGSGRGMKPATSGGGNPPRNRISTMPKQPTPVELIGACVLTGAFCTSIYFAWRAGAYLALAVMVPLALLFLWGVADMLRQGARRPTAFERFEERLLERFILIVFGGGVAVALLYWAGYGALATLLVVIVAVAGLFSASKLRGRNETSAGYKRRVGYRDPA